MLIDTKKLLKVIIEEQYIPVRIEEPTPSKPLIIHFIETCSIALLFLLRTYSISLRSLTQMQKNTMQLCWKMNAVEIGVVFMAHGVAVTRASRVRRRTFSLSPDSPPRLWQRTNFSNLLGRRLWHDRCPGPYLSFFWTSVKWTQINEVNSPTSLFSALPGSFYLLVEALLPLMKKKISNYRKKLIFDSGHREGSERIWS